jgi:signal transduction histidine kinase
VPETSERLTLTLAVVALAGLVASGVAVAVALTGDLDGNRGLVAGARGLTVAVPLAVGLWAWHDRPDARFGKVLTVAGFGWFLTTLAESDSSGLYSFGRVAGWVFELGLIYLFLAFPTGRLTKPIDRKLVWAAAILIATLYLPTALLATKFPVPSPYTSCHSGCPSNAFFLGSEPGLVDSVMRPLREVLTALLFLAVTARLAQRTRTASPLTRRALGPVLVVGLLRSGALAVALVARAITPDSHIADWLSWVVALGVPSVAVAFFLGLAAWRLYCAQALEHMGAAVQSGIDPAELRTRLAAALGDPSLRLFRLNGGRADDWVDELGNPSAPTNGSGQTISEVGDGRRVRALLVHDASLDYDPEFVAALKAFTLITLKNEELNATVESSLRELRQSRARIVSTADRERRRIERDLHDGAQQRLVALRVQLELAEELLEVDHAAGVEKLHSLGPEVDEALDEIRHLARGVYPPLLAESGLVEALTSAVRKLPIAGLMEPDGAVGRYPSEIESAVYFCCLEAMQNASKHAEGAHQVVVSLHVEDDLRFEVQDDGAGFADAGRADGRGLTNMRDRIAAVGGEMTVTSELGEGTRVAGSVPL